MFRLEDDYNFAVKLADKIKIIRKARNLSQEDLGFSLYRVSNRGISRQSVSDWETGKKEPKLENIRDLAQTLDVSFDSLLDESLDLNDPQTLQAVLSHQEKESGESYLSYDIQRFNVHFLALALAVVCLVFGILYFQEFLADINTEQTTVMGKLDQVAVYTKSFAKCLPFFIVFPVVVLRLFSVDKIGAFEGCYLSLRLGFFAHKTIYLSLKHIRSVSLLAKPLGLIEIRVEGRDKPIRLYAVLHGAEVVSHFLYLQKKSPEVN